MERVEASPSEAPVETLFGQPSAVRVERAAAELRAGRPVLVENGGEAIAVLAPDAATPQTFRAFAEAADGRHSLYLSPARAGALGLVTSQGALVPLGGSSPAEARALANSPAASLPAGSAAAPALATGASELARLALLLPGVMVAPLDPRTRHLFGNCARVSLGDLAEARSRAAGAFEIVARTPVPLKGIEAAEFVVFRGGLAQRDQLAIVVGAPDGSRPVPVRVHSSCLTGDLFGSLKCDCGDQLRLGLKTLQEKGGGVLLYLDQEGRGTGIASKMQAYRLQCDGLDTVDADSQLGFGLDERRYEAAVAMLLALGYRTVDLLTNNPLKIALLRQGGIEVVGRTPVMGEVTPENRDYLRTKAERAGHLLDIGEPPART
nr:GTP cyclohydrolase II RibA [Aureimonas populi]